MTGVTNGDGSKVDELFGMQTGGYYHSNAPGSAGASGQADDAVPTEVTPPSGAWYDRHAVSSHGTILPAQTDTNAIEPGPAIDYTDSGDWFRQHRRMGPA